MLQMRTQKRKMHSPHIWLRCVCDLLRVLLRSHCNFAKYLIILTDELFGPAESPFVAALRDVWFQLTNKKPFASAAQALIAEFKALETSVASGILDFQ